MGIKFRRKILVTAYTADLVTFTEEILNEKLYFLCSAKKNERKPKKICWL